MTGGEEEAVQRAVGMANDVCGPDVQCLDHLRQILSISNGRVVWNGLVVVGVVVAAAVVDNMIMLGKCLYLLLPVPIITERTVNKNQRWTTTLLNIVQGHAVAQFGFFERRRGRLSAAERKHKEPHDRHGQSTPAQTGIDDSVYHLTRKR